MAAADQSAKRLLCFQFWVDEFLFIYFLSLQMSTLSGVTTRPIRPKLGTNIGNTVLKTRFCFDSARGVCTENVGSDVNIRQDAPRSDFTD